MDLKKDVGWVVMIFDDMTVKCVHTTLNKNILGSLGVRLRENFLFDLDRGIFIPIRADAKQIEVCVEEPDFGEGVLNFAKRFI